MHEIVSKCRIENIDLDQAQAADRAHRLSDPRRGAADRRPVQGRARRMVPLGRHHAGHHRHRRPSCRSAPRSTWSRRTWRRSPPRSRTLSRKYRDTPMAGRSNLQQAVPITFGFKMAALLAAMRAPPRAAGAAAPARAGRRVRRRRRHARVARQATASKVQAALCRSSGSASRRSPGTRCATASARSAASSASSPARSARSSIDVKLMMQTEVAEVFEPFHEGRGSSSTMPQKRNPISSRLHPLAPTALVRQHVAALLEAMVADHERSTGPWEIEWIALPEIFLLAVRRAVADHGHGRRPRGRRRRDARQSRHHARPDRVGGRDDGARRRISAASARTISSTTSAARWRRPARRSPSCWREDAEISRHLDRAAARRHVRSGELSRPVGRDGRPGAGAGRRQARSRA